MKYIIKEDKLADSSAFLLVLKARYELLKKGLSDKYCLEDFYNVIYAEYDKEVVGVIVFSIMCGRPVCWITIMWVEPEHRKKGVLKKMLIKLKKYVKEDITDEIKFLDLGTHFSNTDMQEISEKLGFSKQWINYRKTL